MKKKNLLKIFLPPLIGRRVSGVPCIWPVVQVQVDLTMGQAQMVEAKLQARL